MKRTIYLLLLTITIFCLPTQQVSALTEMPNIVGISGVVIDANTGTIIYDKQKDAILEPASTTKIMTALLAFENLDFNKKVIIDEETSFTPGSRIYLLQGEEITVEELMYALLLESANDSAVAIAKEISGSTQEFAKLMNKRAKEIGAKNTNFVNPHGLHEEGHYSTAYDLSLIAKEAMKNKKFREYILTYNHTIAATNKQPERYLYNTNRLIYDRITKVSANGVIREAKYEGATGIKTGYTPEAGGCLVAGAKRGGSEFISVVLKSTDMGRFGDNIALLDYAFDNFKSVVSIEGGTSMGTIKVKNGAVKKLELEVGQLGGVTLPKEASESIVSKNIVLGGSVKAPIEKGQEIGTVEIYEGDILRQTVPIIATKAVEKGTILSYIGIEDEIAFKIFLILKTSGFAIFSIIGLGLIYVIYKRKQIKKKKIMRNEKLLKMAKERNVRH